MQARKVGNSHEPLKIPRKPYFALSALASCWVRLWKLETGHDALELPRSSADNVYVEEN